MHAFGYLLQLFGLILLPIGMYLTFQSGRLHTELIYLTVGAAAFLIGRQLERKR